MECPGTVFCLPQSLYVPVQKRLAKEARAQELQAKNAALGKKAKETPVPKGIKGRGEASFYRVTCKVRIVSASVLFWYCIDLCTVFDVLVLCHLGKFFI